MSEASLAAVQRRRKLPTRLTQSVQLLIQNRVISRVIALPAEHVRRPARGG